MRIDIYAKSLWLSLALSKFPTAIQFQRRQKLMNVVQTERDSRGKLRTKVSSVAAQ